MSNELLPSPDILAAPLNDVERAENEIVAADRDRDVLVEYVSRRADMQTLVDTFARLEAVVREPLDASTDVPSRLPDLLATTEQIEAVLRPGDTSASDVHFAVERIQDIAMALSQREVEPALCDTLEAAIREVGDAIVRNEATAAARAQGATALLGDLARRVTDLIALAASVEEGPDAGGRGVEVEAAGSTTDWFDNTFDRSMTDTGEGLSRSTRSRPDSLHLTSPKLRQMRRCLCRNRASMKGRCRRWMPAPRSAIRSWHCIRVLDSLATWNCRTGVYSLLSRNAFPLE
jgi:hypothetical protein